MTRLKDLWCAERSFFAQNVKPLACHKARILELVVRYSVRMGPQKLGKGRRAYVGAL